MSSPTLEHVGYLGLGSNVGDRRAHLQAAVDELARSGVAVLAASSVYETEPVGEITEQPEFLNATVRIGTTLAPDALLERCKEVERQIGRAEGGPRHGPRVIDVDVLLLGDQELSSERLILPHPELRSRRFVLVPMLELAPALTLPDGTRLSDLLEALEDGTQAVHIAEPPLAVPSAG